MEIILKSKNISVRKC